MAKCVCGKYKPRVVTNVRGVESIVCSNCGRPKDDKTAPRKKNPMNNKNKDVMDMFDSIVERINALEKTVSKLTNMNLQQPKERVSGRQSKAPKRVVYHYRIRDRWDNISNLGGVTVVFEQKDGVVYSGIAVCSLKDNYNKRLGINIAMTRMKASDYQTIPSKHDFVSVVEQTKINGRTVQDYLDIFT